MKVEDLFLLLLQNAITSATTLSTYNYNTIRVGLARFNFKN